MAKEFTVFGRRGKERLVRDILKNELCLSARAIKRVKCGGITVDGRPVTVRHVLSEGEVLCVRFPDEIGSDIAPQAIPIEVLYEDEHILAVNKPSNMPVHPCRGNHLPTLAEAVMYYVGDVHFVFRAVNRLDRDTSGVVLIAKDADSAYRLGEQLKRGDITKEYVGICVGIPSPRQGTVDAPIAREHEGEVRRVVREDGKRALTHYEVIGLIKEDTGDTPRVLSRVHLRLETGRTHQIRVHMAHIGTPLLYDFLYGERVEGKHYLLHAQRISFIHPSSGERVEIESPCPF